MNDLRTLDAHGPAAPPLRPKVRRAARDALDREIAAAADALAHAPAPMPDPITTHGRRRRARRFLGAAAVAATVTALSVWGPGIGTLPGTGVPTAAAAVVLAPFAMPEFPVSLSSTPPNMGPPLFDGSPTEHGLFYNSRIPGSRDQVTLSVGPSDPGWPSDPFITTTAPVAVTVQGHPGQFAIMDFGVDTSSGTEVLAAAVHWELRPGLWVSLGGSGTYTDRRTLLEVAETVTDRPQSVVLELGLAPAGWTLAFFKNGGSIVTLRSDTDPDQTLTVSLPEQPMEADTFPSGVESVAGDAVTPTINDRPALLVPTANGWFLQASTPDGSVFILQAPSSFTLQQVVDVASQVSHG